MDFADTAEQATYRKEVQRWIAANRIVQAATGRERSDPGFIADAKAWQALKAANGYAAIRRPKAWGGGGRTMMEEIVFAQEEEAAGLNFGIFMIGVGMCVPTLVAHAQEEARDALIAPTIRGEKIWCQLFSEPSAGSDLANVRTRAVRDGEGWIINGQKVWNSFAHRADYGLLLTRTDPAKAKHKGLTMFWIDMKAPGVDVRPIHQANGEREFNEVFLTDLRLSDAHRVGAVDAGWNVALTTLMNERMSVMSSSRKPDWEDLLELMRELDGPDGPLIEDRACRSALADYYVRAAALKFTRFRLLTDIARSGEPGPAASMGKIVASTLLQEISSEGVDLMDQFGIIADAGQSPLDGLFQKMWAYSPAARLGGGTDEILRNVIAERVLGLPGEIRVDKDKPFEDLPIAP